MKQQELEPAVICNNLNLLDFVGEMTLNEFIFRQTEKFSEYMFFFWQRTCSLKYDPEDNWISLNVSEAEEEAVKKNICRSVEQWMVASLEDDNIKYVLKPESLGKWRYYIEKEPQLEYLPIDNKSILEEFTDAFHNGNYVETVTHGKHVQTFVCFNAFCTISYTFGKSDFVLNILDSIEEQRRQIHSHWDRVIKEMREINHEQGVGLVGWNGYYNFVALTE